MHHSDDNLMALMALPFLTMLMAYCIIPLTTDSIKGSDAFDYYIDGIKFQYTRWAISYPFVVGYPWPRLACAREPRAPRARLLRISKVGCSLFACDRWGIYEDIDITHALFDR